MFNYSTYYQQARELPAETNSQLGVLKLTDNFTELRETGKLVTVIGSINAAASIIFGYNPTLTLSATAIGAFTWIFYHQLAQNIEPHARYMLEYFKDLNDERKIDLQTKIKNNNVSDLKCRLNNKRLENSKRLMTNLKLVIQEKIKDENSIKYLYKLLDLMFLDNIKELTINNNLVEINLYAKTSKTIHTWPTTLNIPQRMIFSIENNALIFKEESAPKEDRTGSFFIKSNFAWWEIRVIENEFELVAPHHFGLFTAFVDGDPVIRRVNADRFFESAI